MPHRFPELLRGQLLRVTAEPQRVCSRQVHEPVLRWCRLGSTGIGIRRRRGFGGLETRWFRDWRCLWRSARLHEVLQHVVEDLRWDRSHAVWFERSHCCNVAGVKVSQRLKVGGRRREVKEDAGRDLSELLACSLIPRSHMQALWLLEGAR